MPDPSPLAAFLRARREQVSPADVGLRTSGRRRTPGLRREELATLAGVSIDYLIRLEQGRDTNPSPAVLRALSDALRFGDDERMHLAKLAARTANHELCPSLPPLTAEVAETTQLLLDQLDPAPAFVLSPITDVVASNAAFRTLAGPLGLADQPNLALHTFTHPAARSVHADWDAAADAQVGQLRAAAEAWSEHERFVAVLAALAGTPGFDERWAAHPVAEKRRGPKRLVHPTAGPLELRYETLGLPDVEQRLVVWLAADDATAASLGALVAGDRPVSPAVLRVVGGT